MNRQQIILRQKRFVLDVVNLCDSLPKGYAYSIFSRQLIRCSSSVGANYRAAGRAKSDADFINKLKIVEEEADESCYWLDLILSLKGINSNETTRLLKEAEEILAITVASIVTVRKRVSASDRKSNIVNRK
ncbi:MAG: four helix bundle protein [Cytophagia bacterium]|nr:four helix bundle protein [Cytophagia bacterium]